MQDGGHEYNNTETPHLDLKNLNVISVLGRGAKGVVFLVQTEKGDLLALKAILRSPIEKNQVPQINRYRRICFEREVLGFLNHPLLPKLHGFLQTENIVGYAIDYCPGLDLHSLRKKQTEKTFSDEIIRFYAAELVLALDYLHGLGIVYRDLKPENVLIQENGHLMLVDFDLSTKLSPKSAQIRSSANSFPKMEPRKRKKYAHFFKCCNSGISPEGTDNPVALGGNSASPEPDSMEKSNSFVGTEYVAPEIILGDGHDFSVDWWCLGVMLYEMLYGKTPFKGIDRKDTFRRILSNPPDLPGEMTPLRDLIRKLLEKEPRKRISVEEIKGHDFFRAVDWDLILEISRTPFIPGRETGEDWKGNKRIDVESYVHGVFRVSEDEKVENNSNWVEGLNHPNQVQNDNFCIF